MAVARPVWPYQKAAIAMQNKAFYRCHITEKCLALHTAALLTAVIPKPESIWANLMLQNAHFLAAFLALRADFRDVKTHSFTLHPPALISNSCTCQISFCST